MDAIALDRHTHLVPVGDDLRESFDGVVWDGAAQRLDVDGHRVGMAPLFRPDALLAWMDANAVARAWISLPPPLYRPGLAQGMAERWAGAMNEGLARIAARTPDRLEAMPHLPVEHPALAARIAGQLAGSGVRRFAMAAGAGPGVTLSDPAYAALWHVLDAAGAFLFLHPGDSADPRLDPFYLGNLFGNPSETALAACHLLLGGVLQRHPRMQVALAHGGGTLAMVAARLARGQATARPGLDPALEPIAQGLQRFQVDCVLHDPAALALADAAFGPGNVFFGSDWPFPMGLPDPHAQLASLPPERRRAILTRGA